MSSQFKVKGELSLDGSRFAGGLRQAEGALGRFSKGAIGGLANRLAGLFAVGAMASGIRHISDFSDSMDEAATRIGVSTDAIQEWTYAAKMAGAHTEDLIRFMERLTAAAGTAAGAAGLSKIGINANQTPQDLFYSLNRATRGKSAPEIQAMLSGVVTDIRALGPVMNILRSDMEAMGNEARRVGAVIDQATLTAFSKLSDELSVVSQILMGNFAPALLTIAKYALSALGKYEGGASWLGARTANMHPLRDWRELILGDPIRYFVRAWREGNRMGMGTDAANAYKSQVDAMDAMLARLSEFVPYHGTPIVVPSADTTAVAGRGKFYSDSLLAVGNFLGGNRNQVGRVAEQQLERLDRIAATLREIKNALDRDTLGLP